MAEINEITVDELAAMELDSIFLIDVREKYEFVEMRVPGAVLLPLAEVPDQIEKFPKDQPVYIICASGNRSRVAGDYLSAHHIEAVNVAGGTKGWVSSGRKFLRGDIDLQVF